MKSSFDLAEKYRRENALMAAIILSNREKHSGLAVEWAKLFQLKQRGEPREPRGQGTLFQTEAA